MLSSIQAQLQMKRKNIGGQSSMKWRTEEDPRGERERGGRRVKEIRKNRWKKSTQTELAKDRNKSSQGGVFKAREQKRRNV